VSPAGPPVATLTGLDAPAGGALPGSLGSWTWGDAGDDAPWIVPSDGGTTRVGAGLAVALDPGARPSSWVARWAPVDGGTAGDALETAEGTGPVRLDAPARAGAWSLQLDARFGPGAGATWYWLVEVAD
jgi:hypothetical protein